MPGPSPEHKIIDAGSREAGGGRGGRDGWGPGGGALAAGCRGAGFHQPRAETLMLGADVPRA